MSRANVDSGLDVLIRWCRDKVDSMAADQENTVQSQQEVQKSLKDLQEKHKTLISKLDSHLESVLDQTSMSRHVLETSAKNMASIFDKALEAFKSSTAIMTYVSRIWIMIPGCAGFTNIWKQSQQRLRTFEMPF